MLAIYELPAQLESWIGSVWGLFGCVVGCPLMRMNSRAASLLNSAVLRVSCIDMNPPGIIRLAFGSGGGRLYGGMTH